MKISVGLALGYAVMGLAIVFVGLLLLFIVITIMGKISSSSQKKATSAPVAAPVAAPVKSEPAPGSAGDITLYEVPDKDAAMIMAIVADKLETPLNELRFKSIREVK